MKLIADNFPNLTDLQLKQFSELQTLYSDWNAKINVISRKDIDSLDVKHVLHSLGIAKVQPFLPSSKVLDVGTGGGFPGIPLAIMFPETEFVLVDSVGKKIKVVQAVADSLGLLNVKAIHGRAENVDGEFDFVLSRAVAKMDDFVIWVKKKIKKKSKHAIRNGILYLKGGDLTEELQHFPKAKLYDLPDYFEDPFFETKKVVHIPIKVRL